MTQGQSRGRCHRAWDFLVRRATATPGPASRIRHLASQAAHHGAATQPDGASRAEWRSSCAPTAGLSSGTACWPAS